MPFSRPKGPEVATLARETQDEIERLKTRVRALEASVANLDALALWVRDELYPAAVVAFALIPAPSPPEPP